jgi:hypothetical protein
MIPRFRIFDKRSGQMSVNGFINFTEGPTMFYVSANGALFMDDGDKIRILHGEEKKRFVVMWSTGLKDKNGIYGFCDDIIKSGNGRIWIIKHGTYFWNVPKDCIELYGFYLQCIKDENCRVPIHEGFGEIIGNSYQNLDGG